MITEQALTELLGVAAEDIEVPAGASAQAWERAQASEPRSKGAALDGVGRAGLGRPHWWVRPTGLRIVGAAAAVVVAVGIVGVAIGTSNSDSGRSSFATTQSGSEAQSDAKGLAAPAAPVAGDSAATVPPLDADRRIAKNASVALEVAEGKVGDSLERLRTLPAVYGGFVAASTSNLSSSAPGGSVTLRVPVAQYGAVRDALVGGSYGKPTSVTEKGSDVTAQYTDLAARLTALQTSRQTYLTLLSNAKSIGDTLAVQQKLDDVQRQIEQLQGQQKLLTDQSDMATLTVTVNEPGAISVLPQERTGFSKAAHDAWDGFTGGLEWLVSISGGLLLAVILVGLLGLAGRIALRRVRRPIA